MAISFSNLVGQTFNDIYIERPVWALASTGTTSSMAQPVVAMYGEKNPYNAIAVEYTGNARSRARAFSDEMANSNYTFYGSTSGPSASSGVSFNGGQFGITQAGSQSACLANFEAFDNGNYGWYNSASAGAADLAVRSGIVVGEKNWRQTYDLILNTDGRLYKDEVGGVWNFVTGSNRPSIALATAATLGGNYTPAASWGYGQIAHNRNTGKLLVVQPVSGVNATSLTFRYHIFDLRMKIGRNTTIAEIQAAMQAATAEGSNRYRYVDIVHSSSYVYYSVATNHDIADTQFVLCDNDEVWAFKSAETSSGGSGNVLWRVNLSGTWLTGTYTATVQVSLSSGSTFGIASSVMYGARHMNSDDNSVIALYQHNYYYICGANIAFVSTKNAAAASQNSFAQGSNIYLYSLAPSGGANFVLSRCGTSTNVNHDGVGAYVAHIDNSVLSGASISPTFMGYLYPVMSSSTAYGMTNIVLKVQPTTEWK